MYVFDTRVASVLFITLPCARAREREAVPSAGVGEREMRMGVNGHERERARVYACVCRRERGRDGKEVRGKEKRLEEGENEMRQMKGMNCCLETSVP